ncbi:MAG: hypothetical protein C0498_13250 [Anaerolinea sp.]|nr:hypothetical protein [Anaerolinea sp.]
MSIGCVHLQNAEPAATRRPRRGARTALVLGVALTVLLAAACQGPAQESGPAPREGRYAVQWTGYLGLLAGQDAYPQLAFIDVAGGRSSEQLSDPVVGQVVLLADSGDIAAEVQTITPSPQVGDYRLFTGPLKVDGLAAGRYEWRRVRYVDEAGAEREVDVGEWVLDVRSGQAATWREDAVTMGATSFGFIEVSLENASDEPLTIRGLAAELPGIDLASQMFALSPSPGPDASAPVNPNAVLREAVDVAPGGMAQLRFILTPRPATANLPFVELQPFIRYAAADGDERLFSISPQVYPKGFAGEADLRRFVMDLPPGAATVLP